MALGSVTPRKIKDVAARTNAQGCDASLDYEADPVSEQEARWLDLVKEAVYRAQTKYVVDEKGNRIALAGRKFYGLKSPAEYAKLPINEMHPLVAIHLSCLLKG